MATHVFNVDRVESFREWILKKGWVEEAVPPRNTYEVARFRKICNSGTHPPLILYTNKYGAWVKVEMFYLPLICGFLRETA